MHGKEVVDSESEAETEIQGARLFALSAVRAFACLSQEIRHVPYLFPRNGAAGRDPRCAQGQLVGGQNLDAYEHD